MKFDVLHNFISPITGRLPLIEDYILIGDNQNFSIASPKLIDIELKLIDIRHEFDDIESSSFIIGFPKDILPHAQVLSVLDNGFMFNTGGVVSTINGVPLPNLAYKNIWIGDSNNIATPNETITIDNLPNLGTVSLTIPNPIDPTSPIVISGGKIWHGTNSNRPEESSALLIIEGDIVLINLRFFTANFILGNGNPLLQALMPGSQFLSNLPVGSWMQTSQTEIGKIVGATIPQGQILMGGINNIPEPQPIIQIENLPNLSNKMVWQGDVTNRPVEIQLDFAASNATYILQQPNVDLPNAQGLNLLGGGILKTTLASNGEISIASSGKIPGINDYISPLDLIEEIEATIIECNAFATAGALAAEAAAISAGVVYFNAQMLPYSLIPFVPAGLSISGAIAAAATLAASAQSSANGANDRITNLSAIGDVTGINNGSDQILTVFAPNPKFTGNEAMKIPYGTTLQRPGNPSVGMIRYNTDL